MQRTGVGSVGSCRQTWYARVYPGVEDQVAENRQEALQGVDSREISQFVSFHKSQTSQETTHIFIFNKLRVVSGVHYLCAKEFETKVWSNHSILRNRRPAKHCRTTRSVARR